jgi:RNase P/RNase MRP subunit p30
MTRPYNLKVCLNKVQNKVMNKWRSLHSISSNFRKMADVVMMDILSKQIIRQTVTMKLLEEILTKCVLNAIDGAL